MTHTLIVIFLFFVLLISPCMVASSIDMDEEEAIAEYKQRLSMPSSRYGVRSSSQRGNRSSS